MRRLLAADGALSPRDESLTHFSAGVAGEETFLEEGHGFEVDVEADFDGFAVTHDGLAGGAV